jgi:hypothetical protein
VRCRHPGSSIEDCYRCARFQWTETLAEFFEGAVASARVPTPEEANAAALKLSANDSLAKIIAHTVAFGIRYTTEVVDDDGAGTGTLRFTAHIDRLAWAQRRFVQTGNPLYVWDAVRAAKRSGEAIPEWALTQLAEYAERITSDEGQAARAPMQFALSALGFKRQTAGRRPGRGTVLSQYHAISTELERIRIAYAVDLAREEGHQLDSAYDAAAERCGVSRSMVRRAYARHATDLRNVTDVFGGLADGMEKFRRDADTIQLGPLEACTCPCHGKSVRRDTSLLPSR